MKEKFQAFVIPCFEGRYRFLSNFYPVFPATIELDGFNYATVEHAFQAAKSVPSNKDFRKSMQLITSAGYAKSLGNKVELRENWEEIKLEIMEDLVRQKFTKNENLKKQLLETGSSILMEGNYWKDDFWGIYIDKQGNVRGENHLGKILMKIRNELRGNNKRR